MEMLFELWTCASVCVNRHLRIKLKGRHEQSHHDSHASRNSCNHCYFDKHFELALLYHVVCEAFLKLKLFIKEDILLFMEVCEIANIIKISHFNVLFMSRILLEIKVCHFGIFKTNNYNNEARIHSWSGSSPSSSTFSMF